MNNRKLFLGVLISVFVFFASSVFAEEATSTKNVTFTVTMGNLECENGIGSSLLKFENTPVEGGYYEITGEMITKNNISLTREVHLPSGTYFWNGVPQSGYSTTTVSSGTFTIKECKKTAPAMQTLVGGTNATGTVIVEDQKVAPILSEQTKSSKTAVSSFDKNATSSQGDASGLPKKVFAVSILVVAVIGVWLKNKYGKKVSV